jgi:hypothetical protein
MRIAVNRSLLILLVACTFLALPGCGVKVESNGDPVEVTFNVSRGGKAVNDVKLHMQAIAKGAGAFGDVKNGVSKITLFPGTYTYYVAEGSSEAGLAGIPATYLEGSMERKLEITGGSTIEVKLD